VIVYALKREATRLDEDGAALDETRDDVAGRYIY
jgi:hypothetical protein